jgi:hypothetical protein
MGKLIDAHAKHCSPTEHFALDQIIVNLKNSHFQMAYSREKTVWDRSM